MQSVHPIVAEKRDALEALCRKYHVRKLELFGSAADGRFDPKRSDLDFLLELEPLSPEAYAEAYLGLLRDLPALFGVSVDLLTTRTIRNPYFLESINQSRVLLYAA